MYAISKTFEFSASHQLFGLPDDHPCSRLHGHNYVVRVEFRSVHLDPRGFAGVDYRDLNPFKSWIDRTLDHRHLNDILPAPTAENIARYLFDHLAETGPSPSSVAVSETPKTWAEYRR